MDSWLKGGGKPMCIGIGALVGASLAGIGWLIMYLVTREDDPPPCDALLSSHFIECSESVLNSCNNDPENFRFDGHICTSNRLGVEFAAPGVKGLNQLIWAGSFVGNATWYLRCVETNLLGADQTCVNSEANNMSLCTSSPPCGANLGGRPSYNGTLACVGSYVDGCSLNFDGAVTFEPYNNRVCGPWSNISHADVDLLC